MKKAILSFLSVPMILSLYPATSIAISGYQQEANQLILKIAENGSFDENINIIRASVNNEIGGLTKQQSELRNSIIQLQNAAQGKNDKVKHLLLAVMVDLNKEVEKLNTLIGDLTNGKLEGFLVTLQKQVNIFKANPNLLSKESQDVVLSNMCEKDKNCVQVYRTLNGQRAISEILADGSLGQMHWYRLSDYGITEIDPKSDQGSNCHLGSPLNTVGHQQMLNARNIQVLEQIVQRGPLKILCQQSRFRGPWVKYSHDEHKVTYMFNIDYGSVTIAHNAKETLFDLF